MGKVGPDGLAYGCYGCTEDSFPMRVWIGLETAPVDLSTRLNDDGLAPSEAGTGTSYHSISWFI